MDIIECKDEFTWIDKINTWVKQELDRSRAKSLFLPAGSTPRPLYQNWEVSGAPFSGDVRLMQLDEILNGEKKNAFRHFFQETLPSYQKQFQYIDEADKCADLAILGLGVNGHVGYHEPGLSPQFYSGCLTLNPETIEHSQLDPGVRVVTYGLQAFLKAKSILLIVRGVSKRDILREVLGADCVLPAAYLKKHNHLSIVTDFKLE
ncbi:MAG: 6-phosphogluconolactonase [Bdellovibrionales bacterium]|nr:6-phosphogluconolactonase [Bdellovibrionales bacterium]